MAAAISVAEKATPSHTGGVGMRPARLDAGVPVHHFLREPQQHPRDFGDPYPAGEDGDESEGHRQAHQRNHERVGREARQADAVEVDHHG